MTRLPVRRITRRCHAISATVSTTDASIAAMPRPSACSATGSGDSRRATAAQPITAPVRLTNSDWPRAARSSAEVWPKA